MVVDILLIFILVSVVLGFFIINVLFIKYKDRFKLLSVG